MSVRLPGLIAPFNERRITHSSYELAVGRHIYVTGTESKVRRELAEDEMFSIPPGQFAQLLTEETVRVPEDSLALISMKSTPKLRGLVNVSGFHVDPGYVGHLLFSVYNAGPNHIPLTRGGPTFLIWYATLDQSTTDLYDGARRGLDELPASAVGSIQGDVASPQALASRVADLERRADFRSEVGKWILRAVVVGVFLWGIQQLSSAISDDVVEPTVPVTTIASATTTSVP